MTVYYRDKKHFVAILCDVTQLTIKFEVPNKCTEVDGCVDPDIIAEKSANHFSAAYLYNDINRAESLRSHFMKL